MTESSLVNKKDMPLEALRGFAAIAVLCWHCMAGFFPQWSGLYPHKWPVEAGLNGQPWFGLIHGSAAVTLFFVLSGFVLTRRFLLTGDQQIIVRGVVKRWPRLAGPVTLTVLISWGLFVSGAYHFSEGGLITGSPWLSTFANSLDEPFEPKLWDAILQGSFTTFFRGDKYYDSSIWTMKIEFIGSFIAFGVATVIYILPPYKDVLRLFIVMIVIMLCYFSNVYYMAFPVGVAMAAFLPAKNDSLPAWLIVALTITSIFLFGFAGVNAGAYGTLYAIMKTNSDKMILIHIIASIMIIMSIELAPENYRRALSSRSMRFIGKLSFPLYLLHVPVLCSFGCVVLIWAENSGYGAYSNYMASLATMACSVAVAVPMMLFNERWVELVNTITNRILSSPAVFSNPPKKAVAYPAMTAD